MKRDSLTRKINNKRDSLTTQSNIIASNQRDSLTKQSINNKRDSLTKQSSNKILTNEPSDNPKELQDQNSINSQMRIFENLRTNLLQWHLLNAEIKERMKSQALKQEVLHKKIKAFN